MIATIGFSQKMPYLAKAIQIDFINKLQLKQEAIQ
jgi:hypothetical protein